MEITRVEVGNILTRSSGFLRTVSSHSLQPYRGCPLGSSLCGQACYVQHSPWITRGRPWGSFLEVRQNAAASYLRYAPRERAWARKSRGQFSIFMASATEPFPAAERRFGVSRSLLEAMLIDPPDQLILQTHTAEVVLQLDLLLQLKPRVHISIETDRERIPGLPPPASPLEHRFRAARALHDSGLEVVITVSPLLPILDPTCFFERIRDSASAVVFDHYIGGDGTPDGRRTLSTPVPAAMKALEPESITLAYRDRMVALAEIIMPGRVGVNIDGFAARYRPSGGEAGRLCGTNSDD